LEVGRKRGSGQRPDALTYCSHVSLSLPSFAKNLFFVQNGDTACEDSPLFSIFSNSGYVLFFLFASQQRERKEHP